MFDQYSIDTTIFERSGFTSECINVPCCDPCAPTSFVRLLKVKEEDCPKNSKAFSSLSLQDNVPYSCRWPSIELM